MKACMAKCGFVHLDGSPGFFYHPEYGAEVVVYVDDFILIAPPKLEAQIWKELDKVITFKDPAAEVDRFLGVYHKTKVLPDGTIQMTTSAKEYLLDAVKEYLKKPGYPNCPMCLPQILMIGLIMLPSDPACLPKIQPPTS